MISFQDRILQKRRFVADLSLFVTTPAVDRARQSLAERGACIISGVPGVGKTTTAEILVSLGVGEGWEAFQLVEGAKDAFRMHNCAQRQLFIFDDFLGRTAFDDNPLRHGESQDLLRLIRLCQRTPQTKRIILTTREYILEQARQKDEVLFHAEIERCVVSLHDYTERIRAEILVNHLYFYEVPEAYCVDLIRSGVAKTVLRHENYSPRIVEWMCESHLRTAKTPSEFGEVFLKSLADPSKLWSHAFENQLSPEARDVIWTMSTIGDSCIPEELLSATLAYRGGESSGQERRRLRQALAELEGNFLEIHADEKASVVRYHNPSVKDFTDRLIRTDVDVSTVLFERSIFFEQVSSFVSRWTPEQFLINEELLVRKVKETIRAESPFIVPPTASRRRASPVRRLADLIDNASVRSTSLKISLAQLAIEYFEQHADICALAKDWVRLYEQTLAAIGPNSGVPTAEQFLTLVLEQMGSAGEFSDVLPLLDGHPMLEQYARSLVSFAEDELDELVQSPGSSSDLQTSMGELEATLDLFSMGHAVDFGEARELLDGLVQREEEHAERYQDEYNEHMYDASEEEWSVVETLNSLLD